MLEVVNVNEALKIIKENIFAEKKAIEKVDFFDSLHQLLAEDIKAQEPLPAFNRATMDGYAVKAKNTFGSSESMPALLSLVGEVSMGETASMFLKDGEAVAIATGAMVPEGSDAICMVEYTEVLGAGNLAIYKPVAPGENLVNKGDDLNTDELVFYKGEIISPRHIALFAAQGLKKVKIYKKSVVGIISTGDELIDISTIPSPGKIRDINSYALSALVHERGAISKRYGITKDNKESLKDILILALKECNMILISGGSSVGERDVTAEVISHLGNPGILFHGVSMRPGKPTIFGIVDGTPIFGLSGNPASAMISFDILVRPALHTRSGLPLAKKKIVKAKLTRNLPSAQGREDYIRVLLKKEKDELWAEPLLGPAGLLSPLIKAHGLLKIDQNLEGLKENQLVEVSLL